jgi:pyruvate kinase
VPNTPCDRRKTKIVATIGPASAPEKRLRHLIEAGVDVCRLNFSHGEHHSHSAVFERIRRIEKDLGKPVAVLQDLCGPKIRTSKLPGGSVELRTDQVIELVAGMAVSDDPGKVGISLEQLADDATAGDRVLIDDGLIELRVEEVQPDKGVLRARVIHGGTLKERKGVNLPDTSLNLPSFTEKDRKDLAWGIEHEVDYVALSFVRHEDDVLPLREMLEDMTSPPRLIAKIERPEAVERLEQIIDAFDAVMVARGDLSVEMPLYQVPEVQKRIIHTALLLDKPVITATQMLDSMQDSPRPTRAEASDVANAIYDGTDAVMLSGETATGRYPIKSVEVMRKIAEATDAATCNPDFERRPSDVDLTTFCDAICGGALEVAEHLDARCLVAFTRTGRTALFMSKWQPKIPILGVSTEERTLRRMALYRGVIPILVAESDRSETLVAEADAEAVKQGIAKKGDIAVYVGGGNLTALGNINTLKVRRVGDAGGVE